MKVKELKERLQTFDQELDVYLYNDKEPALYLADTINKTSDWGEDGWEDFITIFSSTDNKPLFTLTAEEVEIVRFHLAHKQKGLDSLLCQMDNDDEKDNEEYREWESQFNEISYMLTRIKQWQNENNRTD